MVASPMLIARFLSAIHKYARLETELVDEAFSPNLLPLEMLTSREVPAEQTAAGMEVRTHGFWISPA